MQLSLSRRLGPAALLAAPLVLAPSLGADSLITHDGRILECVKARESEAGYTLTFKNGVIEAPGHLLAEVAIEGDMSDYVPKNEDEKKKLEKGFVRYREKWMSKAAYKAALKKRNEERRKQMEERALHTDFSNAWEKETKHFVLRTNTSPELLEHYADLLESYYSLMDKRVGIKLSPTLRRTKMTVNIYKSHDEFLELSTADSPSTLGYFWAYDQTLNFFHDYQEPSRSNWVGLHECTHLLTYLIDPQFRPSEKTIWINEGVADYFGSADIEFDRKGRLEIVPGKLQTDRVLTVQQAIEDGEDTKLEELLRLKREQFNGFQYAHAWSFVYFLNETKKYQKGFKSFFKDLYGLKGVEKAPYGGNAFVVEPAEVRRLLLKKLGHKGTEKLEQEWKEFIAAVPIEAPEARFKRGYQQVRRSAGSGADAALEDLTFAIENGYEDPRAYWALGLARIYKGDFDAAVGEFKKAIELDPLNPSFRFDVAQALCGRTFGALGNLRLTVEGERELIGTDEELAEAKIQFGLAMELSPENELYESAFREYTEMYQRHQAR
ncbi:MAG: DUF1570 domain-containing protein [Planctomycetota bacterium]